MKKILSLCINLMLLMISDAVPLKLIAGDRNVIKKDGATHVISKYYVVPNDYDPNNVTDTTAATQKVSRHMHSRYSKSMDSGTIVKENSENNATTENYQSDDDDADVTVEKINDQVNFRTDLNVGQGEVTNPPDNSTESTVSMSTEQTLDKQTNKQTMDSDDLSKLQVVPIIIPINISHIVTDDKIDTNVNSGEAVQNGGGFIVVNDTDYQNIEDAIDDLILSKFGIAVSDIYSQNLGSFWKLIKLNIDKELGDEELLATIEQLSQLLNIFTNLYEAAQMQHPVEKMIDGIVEILQKPFVEKSNRSESQTETNISGDYDEECLRKCGQKSFKPQLNSNRTTYLSETEASDSLELENLERRQNSDSDDNDLIKMSDDPDSNQETVSSEPTNVLRNQLPVPYNLNVGIPDGYNVLSSMTTPTLIDVARYNDIQEDPNSIQNIPDSTETVESLDLPLTIKSRTSHDLPWSIKDKTIEYFPWPIQTTPNDGLSWHIEDKTSGYHPLTIKYRTSNEIPWNIDSETVPTWTSDPGVTTHGGNILLNPNQSIKSTVHSVKNGIEKPYHIYTYVINPTVTLHKVPNADNVVQVVSRQPHENLKTTLYGLPTLHGENKVVYKNQPPQSHNESQYSLTKPTNNISRQPSYSQLTPHVTKTYDQRYEVNPSTLHSQTPQEDYEPQNFVGKGSEPNHKPARLQSNTHPSESQPTSGEEREAPTVPENDSPPGDLLIPSNPFESLLSFGNTELVSTASVNSSSGDPRNVIDDIDNRHTKPNSYYPYGNINPNKPSLYPASVNKASAHSSVQTSQYPGLISASASSSTYTNGLDEPVYGGQVYQQPSAISTASANSKYTIVQNDNDVPTQVYGGDTNNYPKYIVEPVYSGQVYQQPGAISTASGNSKYTIVQNDNDVPTQVHGGDTKIYPGYIDEPVYGGQVYQQPGAISTATANSKYTIVQNDNDVPIQVHGGNANIYPGYIDEPVYGGQVYKQPGGIPPPTANSKYTIVQNDKDVPIQVHGADINPGYISKAIAHSEYTNVPIDYGHDTNTQPGLISEIHQQPVYPNAVDDFDDSIPVNGEQIQKHPSYISKASAHSVYTIPVNFNVPTHDNKVALDIEPAKIQNVPNYPDEVNHYIKTNPVNGGPKQIRDKFLVPYQPYGPIVHVIHQPSLIKTIVSNQNLKLAPTYRLFALQNLQNLKNTIIKTIQIPGRGFYDDRALINLKNIINVILLLAENLEETDGTNAWYEKIFYNSEHSQHPLRHYVYNLIRQRWLHELMLVLYKNNFSINILQNLGIFSLLKSWQFPKYVQNFIEAEELLHVPNPQNYNDISKNINDLQHKFSVHTYDNLLEAPVDLAKYVTKNVIDSYKTPNKGIVLSIGGVEAEPDANAIINILQNYLNYKNYIETQDNENVFENKVEMLKQIILFLKKKGYGPNTIADLIQKLNTAVYSTEKRGCKTQPTNFTKYMYDVILPVLRRSGR